MVQSVKTDLAGNGGQGGGQSGLGVFQGVVVNQQFDKFVARIVIGRVGSQSFLQFVQRRFYIARRQQGLRVFGVGEGGAFGRQVFVQKGLDLAFGHRAHEAIGRLAGDHEHARGDAADAKGFGELLLLVRVDLDQFEAPGVIGFDLFQQRPYHFAGTAPGGPEVQ